MRAAAERLTGRLVASTIRIMSKRERPRACASTGRRRGRGRALLGRVAATLALLAAASAALAVEAPAAASAEAQAGPVTFTFGGQLRLRYENDEGFTIKGYEPGGGDELLLTRVRLDLAARLREGPRFVLQLQDARAFLTRFDDSDFPASSPIEDTLDVRQLHVEWLRIGGSPFGLKVGRQQIAYGDQRVFGPGNWGNTGRFAWDAAMLKLETKGLASDLWVGAPLTYRSDVWPNRPVEDFRTLVSYTEVKRLPFRLDLFYVLKSDDSGAISGESGTGDLRSHTFGFQAEGKVVGPFEAAATFAVQRGRHGGDQRSPASSRSTASRSTRRGTPGTRRASGPRGATLRAGPAARSATSWMRGSSGTPAAASS
jgi:hypothetical protein